MAKYLVYQLYLISWKDRGGIKAATEHLFRIKELGFNAVWVGPIYPSPWHDHGYDISDYYGIHPSLGTEADFIEFVAVAHQLGLEVMVDLVLNHTSTKHEWLTHHPEYYCWDDQPRPGWQNLFDGGSAWEYSDRYHQYYLHLFDKTQADLNWYPKQAKGDVNWELVKQFQQIIDYLLNTYNIDGFRLDVPQAINKDFAKDDLEFSDLLFGDRAAGVLNAIFGDTDCTLMMECFDPTMGELVEYYLDNTPVDYVCNILVKDAIQDGITELKQAIEQSVQIPGFMLDLESHDSPRLPSRGVEPQAAIDLLFGSGAQAICLYQGQELGLSNPTPEELPDYQLVDLDAQTNLRFRRGELLQDLRPLSRANARVPLSLKEYTRQEQDPGSYLNYTKRQIAHWLNL